MSLNTQIVVFLQDVVMSALPYWRLVFGAILAGLVIWAPGGLAALAFRGRTSAS